MMMRSAPLKSATTVDPNRAPLLLSGLNGNLLLLRCP